MNLLYCFCNASLSGRILAYLRRKLKGIVEYVTVIFFNDFWLIRIKLKPCIESAQLENCHAVLEENGTPYETSPSLEQVFSELDAGCDLTAIMNYYQVAIVSHGDPHSEEIEHFQRCFIHGLGYCPPSLV